MPSLSEVRNDNWEVRRRALIRLTGADAESYQRNGTQALVTALRKTLVSDPSTADERKKLLIELLSVENDVRAERRKRVSGQLGQLSEQDRFTDGQSNYYGDVIASVVTLNDPRSLDVLLGAITTGGMATSTVASFGKIAIDPLLKRLDDSDFWVRAAVVQTLSQMLEGSPEVSNDFASRAKIKAALTRGSSDANFVVRMNTIDGLLRLGDQQSIAIVDKIAKSDPYRSDGVPGLEGRYIVRERAAKALKARNSK